MELPPVLNELREKRQWVCHKNKVPKNPNTGYNAKADEDFTWSDFDTAIEAMAHWNFDGVGFQFGYFEPYSLRVSGIDLDHVVRPDGTLEPFAQEIVDRMNSYTELSPSGNGLHILCYTKTKDIGNRVKLSGGYGLEMYTCNRYFTITGNVFGTPKPLADRTDEFNSFHERYFPPKTDSGNTSKEKSASSDSVLLKKSSALSASVTDSELWDRMFSSSKGAKIRALYEGDTSSYSGDDSSADLALCSYLVYWTGGDAYRVDSMFRQSGLMRPKWDERRGTQTYGERTISRALDSVRIPDWSTESVALEAGVRNESKETISKTEVEKEVSVESVEEMNVDIDLVISQNVNAYINSSAEDWGVRNDLKRFRNFANRKTGFSNIDEKVSLYPGLYVLGAISSLGKTTFIHQMSDQLCSVGEHVLFFSLEQNRLELVTKGVSRLTAKKDMRLAVSSIDIRNGKFYNDSQEAVVNKAFVDYAKFTEHEIIVECSFATSVSTIVATVKKYIEKTKILPIVVVDYLQVIYPLDTRLSTKDAVDMNVRALKNLQKDHNLVVILVSSLNRANYLTPIDFESFKESGGIEYTADVIWGLQLKVMNDEIFDKDKGLKAKRETVRKAKKEKPRKIEFVCLKNRYGESSYSCYFDYYPQYDYFVPSKSFGIDDIDDDDDDRL